MITVEKLCDWMEEHWGVPCVWGFDGVEVSDFMGEDGWCDKHCEDGRSGGECWLHYFERTMGESNENSKVPRKENRS